MPSFYSIVFWLHNLLHLCYYDSVVVLLPQDKEGKIYSNFLFFCKHFCTNVLDIIFPEYFFSVCVVFFIFLFLFECLGSQILFIAHIFSNFFQIPNNQNAIIMRYSENMIQPDNVPKNFRSEKIKIFFSALQNSKRKKIFVFSICLFSGESFCHLHFWGLVL